MPSHSHRLAERHAGPAGLVTKPERKEWAEKLPSTPPSKQRLFTMSRTAVADSGSPTTPPRRTRRKSAPEVISAACSQAARASAALPAIGFSFSARSPNTLRGSLSLTGGFARAGLDALPEKVAMPYGKLFWDDAARVRVLTVLLERLGYDLA